ncbi:MAG: hypothetical protein WEC59_12230 [Salibacteraceae bacterium]
MKWWLLIFSVLFAVKVLAQERVTTFGVQFKPIVPSNLFDAGSGLLSQNGIDYTIDQRVGYSFGGVMRFGITKWLSIESGISYVRRNFSASVNHAELGFTDTTSYRIIGYEIPVSGLVFVQLSDEIFMNAAFGVALDMFPSDVASGDVDEFYQLSQRRGFGKENSFFEWTKIGLVANIGFEYRTKESGYFYIGGSYHRPFSPIYDTQISYTYDNKLDQGVVPITGNYLTIDFKYFFHEEPKEKKVERDPETMPSWMKK